MLCAQPSREIVVPKEQLRLSDEALDEEITKMLTANNPGAPSNVARYNFKERAYKFEPMVDQMEVLPLSPCKGCCIASLTSFL